MNNDICLGSKKQKNCADLLSSSFSYSRKDFYIQSILIWAIILGYLWGYGLQPRVVVTKTSRRIQFVSQGNNLIRYLLDKIPFDGAQIPYFGLGRYFLCGSKGHKVLLSKHQTNVHASKYIELFQSNSQLALLAQLFQAFGCGSKRARDKEFIGLMEEIKELIAPQQIGTTTETETFFALLCIHFYFQWVIRCVEIALLFSFQLQFCHGFFLKLFYSFR